METTRTTLSRRVVKKRHRARALSQKEIAHFQKTVHAHFRAHGRDLPWRKTTDPYRILVSEVMLQQTQVERVIPKYREFLKKFPTVQKLARASLGDVLRAWSGLGYNRRAKMLWECARQITKEYKGIFPKPPRTREHVEKLSGTRSQGVRIRGVLKGTVSGLSDAGDKVDETFKHVLMKLRGVGPYTAGAISAFAYNKPVVMIETNIRSAYLHHFFKNKEGVSDKELLPLIEATLDHKNPRLWYNMLMDYGSSLKVLHGNPNRKSKHHTKQKPFKGSDREIRGAILRELGIKAQTIASLVNMVNKDNARVRSQLKELEKEGMVAQKGQSWRLP